VAQEQAQHIPVLAREVARLLAIRPGERVLDATVGLGGHARMLAEAAGADGLLIGLDVDPVNLSRAAERLEGCGCPYRLLHSNFRQIQQALAEVAVVKIDVVLADLGLSSNQLANEQRGFSFQTDAPLDMRIDDRLADTAANLVNRLSESELADLFYHNAEERGSRRIAAAICRARRAVRITHTMQLANIVARALGVDPSSRKAKIHPATRTFQALRIAVNDELGALRDLLERAPRCLQPGGRLGVISFHSLEDRLVKQDFLRRQREGVYDVVTRKPVTAGAEELRCNARSRSAKLRVAVRTNAELHG
jgi:16S rRNA (cytosine1402-N4)-methyltransferase